MCSRTVTRLVLLAGLMAGWTAAAFAFDDKRDGSAMGIGLGFCPVSNWSAQTTRTSQSSWDENKNGWMWQFLLGAGRGQTIFGFETRACYFHSTLVDARLYEVFVGPVWYQYLGPVGRSSVLLWGIGADILHSPDMWSTDGPPEKPSNFDIGWAWTLGAGYEFRPHWHVTARLTKGNVKQTSRSIFSTTSTKAADFTTTQVSILVQYLAY